MNIRQAVAFAILMQGGGGILDKHPSYLLEKLKSCQGRVVPEGLLDSGNMAKFRAYAEKYDFDWNSKRDYWDVPMNQFDNVTGEALIREKEL